MPRNICRRKKVSLLSLKERYIENGIVPTIRFIVSMALERRGDWTKCSRYLTTFLFFISRCSLLNYLANDHINRKP